MWLLSIANGADLFVFNLEVHALVDFVPAPLVARIDRLAGLVVDQLLAGEPLAVVSSADDVNR